MEVNKFRSKRKRGRRSFLAGESLGRTTSITQAGQAGGATVAAKRVDFTFTADSRLESLTQYNSTTAAPANLVASSAFAYDNLGRLSTLSHSKNSTSIATYGFTYDASTQIASIAATSQVGVSGTSNFSYDATGQLTTTDHTHITDEAYAYDTSGNRTGSGITIGTNNRMSTDGTFNYTYDNEGNLTVRTRISTANANDKTITYTWDHRNRLTSIVYKNNAGTKTKEAIYEYDVFDRRTKKSVDLDGAGSGAAVVSRYVYDGEDILATTNSSGTVTSRLLHGPAVDQILAIETASNGAVHWALTDQLGSVRDIVDNSGNVANHIVYDSFGNVASETASSVDYLFGFTGRERDEESDLNYHRARYYSSSIGRWLSEDPIGFSAGDTNLRRYLNNNPVNFIDPAGTDVVQISEPVIYSQMWSPPKGNDDRYAKFIGGNPAEYDSGQILFPGKDVVKFLNITVDDGGNYPVETSQYQKFKKGCLGLQMIRLNSDKLLWNNPDTRAFTNLEAAMKAQAELLPVTPRDHRVVISFFQSAYLDSQMEKYLLPDSRTEYDISRIGLVLSNPEEPPNGTYPCFDYGTVHQHSDLSVLFFEDMPYGITENPTLDVKHFVEFSPPDVTGVVFFVTPVLDHPRIPMSPFGTK